jgi:uncharacterized membrane-anchored protein YjiN (DUF445 family)
MSLTISNKMIAVMTIVSSFGFLLSSNIVNNAFSAAVPVSDPNTGDKQLDKAIPDFFSCLKSAIKDNQKVDGIKSYFLHEPTVNEMHDCFQKTIENNNGV